MSPVEGTPIPEPGSTGAGAEVYLAQYPADVVRACVWFAVEAWRSISAAGFLQERMGDYFYAAAGGVTDKQKRNMTWRLRRPSV